eukprot:jgi/Tetstr1/420489/TSEL_011602.t1
MESDGVESMHLDYAATFDPSVYLACGLCSASTRRLMSQPPTMPPLAATARWCANRDVYRMMPRTPLREATEGGADAAADEVPPAVVDAHRRAAKLTAAQRARQALDTADLEHIRDQDVPSWRLWVNRCMAGRCHSRTAAFLASGTVFALDKDDPAAREERAKSGESLRVRPLGVGSVLVRKPPPTLWCMWVRMRGRPWAR